MPSDLLNPLRKRKRRQALARARRRKRNRRFGWKKAGLALLFGVCLVSLHLTGGARPPPVHHARHVPVAVQEKDVPGRALVDPNPDPWDDGVLGNENCKESCGKKEGRKPLFRSMFDPGEIGIPAPQSTGLLLVGFTVFGVVNWRRRKRLDETGGKV
jgi:hypothetical protein